MVFVNSLHNILFVSTLTFIHDKRIDINIILHLIQLKMKPDKEHIHNCLLFCHHQKKSAADHTELFVRYIMKIPLECVRTDLNNLKTTISISAIKNALDALLLWKRTNCGIAEKCRRK